MAAASKTLQESCDEILRRHQQREHDDRHCFLCPVRVRGQDTLLEHLASHQITCMPFDDVVDLDGFLACLKSRLISANGEWRCPVCSSELPTATPEALTAHITDASHAVWSGETIPELRPFCMTVDVISEDDGGVLHDVEDMDDEASESGDEWEDECLCLYCSNESTDCLSHMMTAHDFDFRGITRQREDVKDEYDLIWLINAVRRAVFNKECPFGGTACAAEVAKAGSLEAHLVERSSHRLPATVTRVSDRDLIPVLSGDALISLVVMSGAGFLRGDTADPEYPMVPTVREYAASQAKKDKP